MLNYAFSEELLKYRLCLPCWPLCHVYNASSSCFRLLALRRYVYDITIRNLTRLAEMIHQVLP